MTSFYLYCYPNPIVSIKYGIFIISPSKSIFYYNICLSTKMSFFTTKKPKTALHSILGPILGPLIPSKTPPEKLPGGVLNQYTDYTFTFSPPLSHIFTYSLRYLKGNGRTVYCAMRTKSTAISGRSSSNSMSPSSARTSRTIQAFRSD